MRVFNDVAGDASAACAHAGGGAAYLDCIANFVKGQALKTQAAQQAASSSSAMLIPSSVSVTPTINPQMLAKPTPMSTYLLVGGLAILAIGGAVAIKKHRRSHAAMQGYRRRRRRR